MQSQLLARIRARYKEFFKTMIQDLHTIYG